MVSDVNNQTDFVPGRDQVFEEIIIEERGEQEDDDSLTIIGAGEITDGSVGQSAAEEESEEEEVAEIPVTMPRAAPTKDPFKQPGQCPIAWEAL